MDENKVEAAVAKAREAFTGWSSRSARERAEIMRPVRARILSRAQEIGELLASEGKKPFEEGVLAEVLPNADLVDYWTASIEELVAADEVALDPTSYPGKRAIVYREPRGVIALISPWNYPVAIPLRTIIPAVLAGNTVVFKPSEHASRAGELVASLFAGVLPEDVVVLLQGGPEVGAELIRADVDAVVFTGSVATGKKIGAVCAERLVHCSLELGGKDAAIVLADAPIERTARGLVWGAFTNLGQNCASIERAYVVRSVYEKLSAEIVAVASSLDPGRDVGKMTTDAQAAIVRRHVGEAVKAGAKVLAGAVPEADGDVGPIVLEVKDEACALMREETFGPVLPLVVVESADEAIERANATSFCLTASLWSADVDLASVLARRLKAGIVTINNHGFTAAIPSLPWTGVGETGGGVTNGPHALGAFIRPRMVLEDRNKAKSELWWYPYTPALRAVALGMAKMKGGAGLFGRFSGVVDVVAALPKRLFEGGKAKSQEASAKSGDA